jgi:hypothetical protein
MIQRQTLRGVVAAGALGLGFMALMAGTAHAIDPGFGVGRAGPGVRPALGAPGVGVAPGAPLYRLPKGCVAVVVNGVKMWRCGAVVYRPVVQAGRTVYVIVR